ALHHAGGLSLARPPPSSIRALASPGRSRRVPESNAVTAARSTPVAVLMAIVAGCDLAPRYVRPSASPPGASVPAAYRELTPADLAVRDALGAARHQPLPIALRRLVGGGSLGARPEHGARKHRRGAGDGGGPGEHPSVDPCRGRRRLLRAARAGLAEADPGRD